VDLSGRELAGELKIGMPLTLSAARSLAADVHRSRKLGRDPIAEHKAARLRQRAEAETRAAGSYGALARSYIAEYALPRKLRGWRATAQLLGLAYPAQGDPIEIRGGLAERWGDRDIRTIDGHDIYAVIDEARRLAVPGILPRNPGSISEGRARSLFGALSGMFGWLADHHRIPVNPCAHTYRPPAPPARDRVLSPDELRWFWSATDAADAAWRPGAPRPFGPGLRLLLLTGCRLNEVAGMQRVELRDDGTWHLPGSRTKNGRPHIMPLSKAARAIITAMPGRPELVFSTNGKTPPSGWGRAKLRVDEAMLAAARAERGGDATIAPWRIHDLRRTAVTGMGELGIRPDVIELVVNHVSGTRGGIAGVYNRSELLDERRQALERWAGYIEALVSGQSAKVLPLKRGT
jgi:integrase